MIDIFSSIQGYHFQIFIVLLESKDPLSLLLICIRCMGFMDYLLIICNRIGGVFRSCLVFYDLGLLVVSLGLLVEVSIGRRKIVVGG